MYIEDLILELEKNIFKIPMNKYKSYQLDMIENFSSQINKSIGFTLKQRNAALTIVKSNKKFLTEILNRDIQSFIDAPVFKLEVREKTDIRHVSIVPHPKHIRAIQLNVSYNPSLMEKIRSSNKNSIIWNAEVKAWQLPLNEFNIFHIKTITEPHNFTYSEEFENLFSQCKIHYDNMSNIVPMLDLSENIRPILRNVSEYVPPINTFDIVEALFESRKRGITTWSDSIKSYLDNSNINSITKNFLQTDVDFTFEIDSATVNINCLKDIIKYLSPTVFIIPGGSELQKLKLVSEFINTLDVSSEEVSVLFRLPSRTLNSNLEFNELVRNLKYNNPLSEKTKIAMVSDKIRKPMIQSKIKFHSVINFGTISGAHVTMRNFIRMHENLINYSEVATQRRFNFGIL